MYTIKTSEYKALLRSCYSARQPLFISGGPGIGKSAIPRQLFITIAKEEGKQFVEWADTNTEQKADCIANPDKYWVFADMRTSQMDTTSLVGIPNMTRTDMLENIPYSWVIYFTQPTAHGCIFFDEINLAPPIVQSITYSAIHDRVISDRRLSEHVYIFAAGNRSQDKAHTFDMPLPLRDRFAEAEVKYDVEAWLEWAMNSNINPHLIQFIDWKPANLYNVDKVTSEKPSTPRGVERASKLLKGIEISDPLVHMLVSISSGESFATEFEAYCTIHRQLDWANIIKNPSQVTGMSLDKQYAISAGVTDQFIRSTDTVFQSKLLDVANCLREDFAVFSYRTIANSDRERFKNLMNKLGRTKEFATKYARFLLDSAT